MYYNIPANPTRARPILQRFMQENAAISPGSVSGRRRPQPPRSLVAQVGTSQVTLSWNAPQNTSNVSGYNVYRDNENNRVATISGADTRQTTLPMPSSTTAFYVSCYNDLQESIKVQVIAPGSSGGGTVPSSPPGWPSEPSGGGGGSGGGGKGLY
jgi:hypothetical protein